MKSDYTINGYPLDEYIEMTKKKEHEKYIELMIKEEYKKYIGLYCVLSFVVGIIFTIYVYIPIVKC